MYSELLVGAEQPERFEFNTSTLLEKAFKALLRYFKFGQAFVFCFFIFSGARVWAPIPDTQNQNLAGYITEITCKSKVSVCYT